MKAESKVLIPGCGDSSLSEMLATKMGLKEVTSIDFEADVIEKMKAKKIDGVTFEVMDFLDLKFEENHFDAVIDKGSFDALCCDDTSETKSKVNKYLTEIERVLNTAQKGSCGGKYICVSLL